MCCLDSLSLSPNSTLCTSKSVCIFGCVICPKCQSRWGRWLLRLMRMVRINRQYICAVANQEYLCTVAQDCSSQLVASSIRGYHPLRPTLPSMVLLIAGIQVCTCTNLYQWLMLHLGACIQPVYTRITSSSQICHSVITELWRTRINQANKLASWHFIQRVALLRHLANNKRRHFLAAANADASLQELDWWQPCANIAFRFLMPNDQWW